MSDHHEPDDQEPRAGFAFMGPDGPIDVGELPAPVHEAIVARISDEPMPEAARAQMLRAMGVDDAEIERIAAAHESGHRSDCSGEHEHDEEGAQESARSAIWAILDDAFGSQPHMWRATEAILETSAINPRDVGHAEARALLVRAMEHIARQVELMDATRAEPEQAVEQDVPDVLAQFVAALDALPEAPEPGTAPTADDDEQTPRPE